MRIPCCLVIAAGLVPVQAEAVAGRTRIPHYTLRVQVDPAVQRLEAEVWIRNPPAMRFYLHSGFAVRRIEIRGKTVAFHEDPGAQKLPFSPAARAVVIDAPRAGALHIVYGGVMKERRAGVNEIAPELVELACYSAWYPVFEGLKEYRFDLEARLPESFTAVTNGRQRIERRQDGWVIWRWESYRPGLDIVLLASPLLRRYEDGASGVAVYAHRFPEAAISAKRSALADGIAELSRRFGPPQVNAGARLVYAPRSGWGYARAPLIVVSEQRALGLLGSKSGAEQDFHDNAHELAHFWWMVADPGAPHDWINEGLAEYSAYCVSVIHHGPVFASRRLAEYQHRATQSQTTSSIAETPGDSPDREVNRYNKAPLMFIEAERRFGRARLDRLLRTLHERFAWTGRATTELFLELAAARMGPDAAAFFKQELYRRPERPPDQSRPGAELR